MVVTGEGLAKKRQEGVYIFGQGLNIAISSLFCSFTELDQHLKASMLFRPTFYNLPTYPVRTVRSTIFESSELIKGYFGTQIVSHASYLSYTYYQILRVYHSTQSEYEKFHAVHVWPIMMTMAGPGNLDSCVTVYVPFCTPSVHRNEPPAYYCTASIRMYGVPD